MRPPFPIPRAARCSSPRILFFASDVPGELRRDVAPVSLDEELVTGCVVLATAAREEAGSGYSARKKSSKTQSS